MRFSLLLLAVTILLPSVVFPETLSERKKAFLTTINKEKTDEARIKKVHSIAMDKKSRFRVMAINYLIDTKSTQSGPLMVQLTKDPQVSEFAIYGVGELEVYEATPILIRYMKDENRNNRGNAYRALQKLYPNDFNFEFHHDDEELKRNRVVQNIQAWWKANRERLKSQSLQRKTDAEKKEAEERWEKYGKDYLDRPSS